MWAEKQEKNRETQRHDGACLYAHCAAASASKEKDVLVDKALALLNKARATGYFKDAKRVEHFNQDADFAGVRDHPAFAKFAAELTKHARGG